MSRDMIDRLVRRLASERFECGYPMLDSRDQIACEDEVMALLAELCEPTDAMLAAGDDPELGLGPELVDYVWRRMILAAAGKEP